MYIGVDPGSNFTGVADHDGERFVHHFETGNPVRVWTYIEDNAKHCPDLVVILEDFTGTGRLNNYRKRTIEIVGYIYHRCLEAGIRVVRQINQRRKAYVDSVPHFITGKDEIAAAAHVLAYLVKQRIIRVPNQQAVRVQRQSRDIQPTGRASVSQAPRSQLRRGGRAPRRGA